jgi:hypothetical protein
LSALEPRSLQSRRDRCLKNKAWRRKGPGGPTGLQNRLGGHCVRRKVRLLPPSAIFFLICTSARKGKRGPSSAAEVLDADSKFTVGSHMWVRVPAPAPSAALALLIGDYAQPCRSLWSRPQTERLSWHRRPSTPLKQFQPCDYPCGFP